MSTRAIRLLAPLALLLSAQAFAIPPTYTLQGGLGNDDVDDADESFVYVSGGALFSNGLTRNSIVDFRAELASFDYADNSDRSGEELFLEGVYSFTPKAGFRVPTYSVGLRHLEEMTSDSGLEASTTTLLFYLTYRVDDRSNLISGLQFGDRDATADSTITSAFATVDYRLRNRWILYTTLNLADEDFDSDSGANTGFSPNSAVRGDFAGHHSPGEGNTSATQSDNTFLTFGASYLLSAVDTIEASITRQDYDTSAGNVSGNVLSLDYFHRF